MNTFRTPYLLAIDKGTSVTKCLLFDAQGRELAAVHAPSLASSPQAGWHEEDLDQVWTSIRDLVRRVVAQTGVRPEDIGGIGVTAHMGGLILLDAGGNPVRPAILWDDARAAAVLEQWQRDGVLEAVFEIGGQALLPGLAVPLLRWLMKMEPEALARATSFCATKDFIVMKLTGHLGTDETDAGWMPGDVRARGHSTEVHQLCGVASLSHLFPKVRVSQEVVGGLTPEAAAELGLAAGTPVVAGLGDANASTAGTGAVRAGQAASIIGTSLLNNLVVDRPVLEPKGIGFVLPGVDGTWLKMLPNTGGGSVNMRWLAEAMYRDAVEPYAAMDEDVLSEPTGARGVFFHPYINESGVVAPFYHLGARAQFTGLNVNTGRATVARAVYEGIAMSIVDCYSATPVAVTEVRLAGGAARSSVLCQVVADALGRPVVVPDGEEAAAKGAAMAAAVGVGLFDDFAAAAQTFVSVRNVFEPDDANHEVHARRYLLFRHIREAMQDVWTEMALDRRL